MKKLWLIVWLIPLMILITNFYQKSQLDFSRFELTRESSQSFYRDLSQFNQAISKQTISDYPDYRPTNILIKKMRLHVGQLINRMNEMFPDEKNDFQPLVENLKQEFVLKQTDALSFFEKNSVLRNTQSYLIHTASHSVILQQESRIQLFNILNNLKSVTSYTNKNNPLVQRLKTTLSSGSITPDQKKEAALILQHVSVFLLNRQKVKSLLFNLNSNSLTLTMIEIDRLLQNLYHKEKARVQMHKLYLYVSTLILLLGLFTVIYLLLQSNKKQHRLNEEKFKMQQMMIQSEKMLSIGGLAAGMAHEINNPLAGIVQNLQVIRNRLTMRLPKNVLVSKLYNIDLDNMQSYLEARDIFTMIDVVMASGQRAAKIVNNTLSFSRKGVGVRTQESVNDILDQTINLSANDYDLKKKYDFRKIKIQKHYSDTLPNVFCEASEIQQVLFNILKNGAQAMTLEEKEVVGNPCFTISTAQEDSYVVIRIGDNGPGIDEKICSRIFEPFFTTKSPGVGTGLGLSVSYFIITKNHYGEMSVESKLGIGTTFIIRLPLNAEARNE